MNATIKDVAEKAKVSAATVSSVINVLPGVSTIYHDSDLPYIKVDDEQAA